LRGPDASHPPGGAALISMFAFMFESSHRKVWRQTCDRERRLAGCGRFAVTWSGPDPQRPKNESHESAVAALSTQSTNT